MAGAMLQAIVNPLAASTTAMGRRAKRWLRCDGWVTATSIAVVSIATGRPIVGVLRRRRAAVGSSTEPRGDRQANGVLERWSRTIGQHRVKRVARWAMRDLIANRAFLRLVALVCNTAGFLDHSGLCCQADLGRHSPT